MQTLESPTFAFIFDKNGQKVKLDGLTYRIIASKQECIYPYKHSKYTVILDPIPSQAKEYTEVRRYLNGHWVMDVEDLNDDNYFAILQQLGYYEENKE